MNIHPFRVACQWRLLSLAILSIFISNSSGIAQPIAEEIAFYGDGLASQVQKRPWRMKWEEKPGGVRAKGKCLWFNADWKAHPWAGVTFIQNSGPGVRLDKNWLDKGFIRFYVNGGVDRYSFPGGGVALQLKPEAAGIGYQALRSQFIDQGRGVDEDLATWQEVLVPLSYWTDLNENSLLRGVSIQCRWQPVRTFGLDEIGLVRFKERPQWLVRKLSEDVAQPWVKWPTYEELPGLLKADQHPPRVENGKFVLPNGGRCFLLSPYCREDPRLDLWGTTEDGARAPNHGLYDPKAHGWLYQELPTSRSLCRLGFNSYSATMPPQPWWDSVGYKRRDKAASAERLPDFYKRIKLPFYIDTVAWPWTLGRPNSPKDSSLPADAFTQGRHHWTPYRIIESGRETWLAMSRLYAQRYRDAGAPALIFELMNEPAYLGVSDDHRKEFAQWLKKRYGGIERLSHTWRSNFASWQEAVNFQDDRSLKRVPGRFFDYDEYLASRFTELISLGIDSVSAILPGALVGLQTMGGYALRPRESIWKHQIVKFETVVLTPTGGGRWTEGYTCSSPPTDILEHPIASAPLENDLLLALAGTKMIFDNETYLRGQTAEDVRNRLWEHVISGLDGLTIFSWSKRGWAWWGDRAKVQTEADKFPYCNLIPLARRTEALRGIYDFASEVQPLADRILRKPWGPKPAIGLLYDWAQARKVNFQPDLPDKTSAYYAALKYTHWNFAVVPADQAIAGALDNYDVLVMGGVAHIESQMLDVLEAFVQRGGILIAGEESFSHDLYDQALDTADLLGIQVGEPSGPKGAIAKSPPGSAPSFLPGEIRLVAGLRRLRIMEGVDVLLADDAGAPVITRKRFGKGLVYFQAADVIGYPLAKVLWMTLADAPAAKGNKEMPQRWRLAEIRDAAKGQLAPNVLLSRRSYDDHHVLLLMNRDGYEKRLVVRLPGLKGNWRVTDGLSRKTLEGPASRVWSGGDLASGIPVTIQSGRPAVMVIEAAAK